MYYEIYIDTLFLVNFVMNLYLLMLTNISAGRTATRLRLIGASLIGALVYVVGLIITVLPGIVSLLIQTSVASVLMIKVAFRPKNLSGYKKLFENLLGYSFLFGGAVYMLSKYFEGVMENTTGIALVMGFGGLLYLLISYIMENRKKREVSCKVTLISDKAAVTVDALFDTGNGLTEPLSGAPVCVVNQSVLERLWPLGMPDFFRIIPYHSVGCAHGIMQGYMVDEMIVELDGVPNRQTKIFIAAPEQEVAGRGTYEMILNPRVLQSK